MAPARHASQLQPPVLELLTRANRDLLQHFDLEWLETVHKVNAIPEARITLTIPDGRLWRSDIHGAEIKASQPGADITLRIRDDKTILFAGLVVAQECELTPQRSSVTLIVRHRLCKLASTFRSQLFEKKTDRDILADLLSAHDLRLQRAEGLAVRHAQMLQFACSDWQFARSRLLANGVWLVAAPASLEVLKPALATTPAHTLSAQIASAMDGAPIEEASWRYSNADQPARFEVASWRRETQALANTIARPMALGRDGLNPAQLAPLNNATWSVAHSYTLAQDEQFALADASLLARQLGGIQASFKVWGSSAYQVGQTLRLSGYGSHMDGMGLITEVRQKITKGTWFSTLFLGSDDWAGVDVAAVPTIAGLHVGIVAAHEDDSTGLNRIRIRVPALRLARDQAVWARFGMPYASQGAGLCLYPEPGDEVVLGFFEGDPRYPVILGSMHNPRNQAPYRPSAGNSKKGFVLSRDGVVQQMLFDSALASLSLQSKDIVTAAQNDLSLTAGNQTSLSGSAGVAITGAKIDMDNG